LLQRESAVEFEFGAAITVDGPFLNKTALRIMLKIPLATCCDQTKTEAPKPRQNQLRENNGAFDMDNTPLGLSVDVKDIELI
jgi:hypothetical protein